MDTDMTDETKDIVLTEIHDVKAINPVDAKISSIMRRIKVIERDGEFWTDSLTVAEMFGKDHKNILSVIRKIDEENQEVNLLSFKPIEFVDSRGRLQPAFEMTEDGFLGVVNSFNDRKGSDIALIKAAYRKEFKRLRDENKRNYETMNGLHVILTNNLEKLTRMISLHENNILEIGSNVYKNTEDIKEIKTDISEIKSNIIDLNESKRRKISKADERRHRLYTFKMLDGKFPMCGLRQVIGLDREIVSGIGEVDHFYGRARNRIDQTWIVCHDCNSELDKAPEGSPTYQDAEAIFKGYQARLKAYENRKPHQVALV